MDKSREVRQLELILDTIAKYRSSEYRLGMMVSRLDSLLNQLEEENQEWLREITGYWGHLEDINAALRSSGQTVISKIDEKKISSALDAVTKLVTIRLSQLNLSGEM